MTATFVIIGCLVLFTVAGLALACMSIDEPAKTSPARARPLLAFQSGPGRRSALGILLALMQREAEPQGRDLPEAMRIRDHYARQSVITLGARKAAEYDAVLDVMAGEQETAVMEAVSS